MKRRTLLAGSVVACSGVALGAVHLSRVRKSALVSVTGPTMGTYYRVQAPDESVPTQTLRRLTETALGDVESRMSTYAPDSELLRFNRGVEGVWTNMSDLTLTVVERALAISRLSHGAFDPTVGPLVELWGFGASGALDAPPADSAIADAAANVGASRLAASVARGAMRKHSPALEIDLSGIAKGFAVDRISVALDAAGLDSYLIDVGGELHARGRKPDGGGWRVGIERPIAGQRSVHRVVELQHGAIATSGDYRRFFVHGGRRYAHSIDPRTAHPVSHTLASVSVVSADAMQADALSTALMVMGPDEGYEFALEHDIAALFIAHDDGNDYLERWTPDFEAVKAA